METLFSKRLKELRKKYNLTQEQLAKKIDKTRSTVAGYETERKEPDFGTLARLACIFNVSTDYLLGLTDISECPFSNEHNTIPMFAESQHFQNILVSENTCEYPGLQSKITKDGKYFYYKVNDDSMVNSRILPEDLVLIKLQQTIEIGKIFLVSLENSEAVLRRIYIEGNTCIFQPDNPHYQPYILKDIEKERDKVKIIGKAVQVKFML